MSDVNVNLVADADRDGNYHSLANADSFNPTHSITVSHSDSFNPAHSITVSHSNTIADTDSYRHHLLEHLE